MSERFVFAFSDFPDVLTIVSKDKLEGFLGHKGAILSELTIPGIPVPPGFTITSGASLEFFKTDPPSFPEGLWDQIGAGVKRIEESTGSTFGSGEKPFLLAVRNSAEFSMEQTLLSLFHVGLNDDTVTALAGQTETPKWLWTLYLKYIQTYATSFLKIEAEKFTEAIAAFVTEKNAPSETDLEVEDLTALCTTIKGVIETEGSAFPQDPYEQLKTAVEAVYLSWNSEAATEYRNTNEISHNMGFAIVVMQTVFGNAGDSSAVGSYLTRNPTTGESGLIGTFLPNATGPEFITKARQPQPIANLETTSPAGYEKLLDVNRRIETYFKAPVEIDFIVENNEFWVVKTKPTVTTSNSLAGLRMSVDYVNDQIMTKEEAVRRFTPADLDAFLSPHFRPEDLEASADKELSVGETVSSGLVVGQICLTGEKVEELAESDPIFILESYSPKELSSLQASKGYISMKDDAAASIASLCRQQGIPAVFGIEFTLDLDELTITFGEKTLREGDLISIDGKSGAVYSGQLPITKLSAEESPEIQQILTWADDLRHQGNCRKPVNSGPTSGLVLYGNADSIEAVQRARTLGAEGIGLFNTDQLLLGDRSDVVQRVVMSDEAEDRDAALQELEEGLAAEFAGILEAVGGFPAIIRLADPSIQEFIPNFLEILEEVTAMRLKKQKGAEIEPEELEEREKTLEKVQRYHEQNPMVGVRGIRLSLMIPGLLKAQLRAIVEGTQLASERGAQPNVQVLVPFAITGDEVAKVRPELDAALKAINKEHEAPVSAQLGAAIEVPRAAFVAGQLAEAADFVSFGKDQLTELVFGYSREDAENQFLSQYKEFNVFSESPFKVLDREGVGELISVGLIGARAQKPTVSIGVAGENTGDAASIRFLHQLGVTYVSCPAASLAIARLAAAHAILDEQ
jgi:pyruvate,orthophosphate dikinase